MKYSVTWRLLSALLLLAIGDHVWAQAAAPAQAQSEALPPPAPAAAQTSPGTAPAPQAQAQPLAQAGYIDVDAGLAYTSNAFLSDSHTVGSGIAVAGTSTDYGYQGSEVSASALGNLDWVEYLQHSIGGEPYGQLTGTALMGRPSDPLQWQLSDGFGEEMSNPLAAPTPSAVQWVNYVTTGPDLNLNFGLRNRFSVFGQYNRTTYETSPFDSQGYDAGVLLTHGLSAATALSLLVATAHTGFLNEAALASYPGAVRSYDIRTAAVSYTAGFARTQITASLGYNEVRYPEAADGNFPGGTQSKPLGTLRITRAISPFASFYLQGQDSYASAGNLLLSPPAGIAASAVGASPSALATEAASTAEATSSAGVAPMNAPVASGLTPQAGLGVLPAVAVAAPFEERAGSIGWTFQRARTGLSLAGTAMQERFVQQATFDLTAFIVSAGWRRNLSPTLSLQLQGSESFYRFTQLAADNHQTTASLTFAKQFYRTTLSAYAEWLHQSSSVPPGVRLPIALYSDGLVGLNVSYDLIGRRATAGQ